MQATSNGSDHTYRILEISCQGSICIAHIAVLLWLYFPYGCKYGCISYMIVCIHVCMIVLCAHMAVLLWLYIPYGCEYDCISYMIVRLRVCLIILCICFYSLSILTLDWLIFAKIFVIFVRFRGVLQHWSRFYRQYEDNVNSLMQMVW